MLRTILNLSAYTMLGVLHFRRVSLLQRYFISANHVFTKSSGAASLSHPHLPGLPRCWPVECLSRPTSPIPSVFSRPMVLSASGGLGIDHRLPVGPLLPTPAAWSRRGRGTGVPPTIPAAAAVHAASKSPSLHCLPPTVQSLTTYHFPSAPSTVYRPPFTARRLLQVTVYRLSCTIHRPPFAAYYRSPSTVYRPSFTARTVHCPQSTVHHMPPASYYRSPSIVYRPIYPTTCYCPSSAGLCLRPSILRSPTSTLSTTLCPLLTPHPPLICTTRRSPPSVHF